MDGKLIFHPICMILSLIAYNSYWGEERDLGFLSLGQKRKKGNTSFDTGIL